MSNRPIQMRAKPEEKAIFHAGAKTMRLNLSAWMRFVLLQWCLENKVIDDHGNILGGKR